VFDIEAPHVNETSGGDSRRRRYIDESKHRDPARNVGADPTPEEMRMVREYAARLQHRVQAAAEREVRAVTPPGGAVSVRTKHADAILEKVGRMVKGSAGRPGRPNFRVGDVTDAVGARITVENMLELAATLRNVKRHFGVGDAGRILEIENMYAEPKSKNPEYRVISLTVKIEVDGGTFAFELQLTTRRASVASDVEHNTLFKKYHRLTAEQREMIKRMQGEAAALDQEETRI
jgi:ppGpp synthetase/RelA/SpoT-type nucleotidyltranferase